MKNQIEVTGYQMIKFYFKITKQFPKYIYMKISRCKCNFQLFQKVLFFLFNALIAGQNLTFSKNLIFFSKSLVSFQIVLFFFQSPIFPI